MRWNRLLGVIAVTGLLAASCGSEADSGPATTDTAPETATTDALADGTIDDGGVDDGGVESTSVVTSTAPTAPTSVAEPEITTTTEGVVDDAPGVIDVVRLVDAGMIDLTIDVPEGGVSGELLHLSFVNTTDDDVDVVLPCGLVFAPDDDGELQRMMNLTPFDATLADGDAIEVTPFVMCIDSSAPAPGPAASYQVAELADDNLLAFAQCICNDGLLDEVDTASGDMSLQIAVWAAADGELPDIDAAMTEADGALSDLLGAEGIDFDEIAEILEAQGIDPNLPDGFDLESMLGQAMAFFGQYLDDARTLLGRCNIDVAS